MLINKEYILSILSDVLDEEIFIVDLNISTNSKISLFIDTFDGITLKHCEIIHKKIDSIIREKTNDFLLEVSSPGLNKKLKVWQQYKKLINKKIKVISVLDEKFSGKITDANEKTFSLNTNNNEKITFSYDKIKKAKPIISF